MRLYEGLVIDAKATFGDLKFSEMIREVYATDEEGKVTNELQRRVYNLKSRTQECMIQVSVPAEVDEKKFDYNTKVELVNPEVGAVANATFNGATVEWFLRADDIVLKGQQPQPRPAQPQQLQNNQNNADKK